MTPTKQIDDYIKQLSTDWRGEALQILRETINKAAPKVTEDWKWSVPVFVFGGKQVCAISAFKDHVKINFFRGAELVGTNKIFNSGLDSKSHRSINFGEGDKVNTTSIKKLLKQAVALNN